MRIVLLCFLFVGWVPVMAQKGYKVTYQYDNMTAPFTFNGKEQPITGRKTKLVFADSLSFYYFLTDGRDPLKKSAVYGEKLLHHGFMYNSTTNRTYELVAWPKGASNKYIIEDTIRKEDWVFGNDTKKLLGYDCKSALWVSEKNDSVLVWYAPSIQASFGPSVYVGFPGLVLEIYDQRATLQHLVATKIEQSESIVLMPKEGQHISAADFRKLRR